MTKRDLKEKSFQRELLINWKSSESLRDSWLLLIFLLSADGITILLLSYNGLSSSKRKTWMGFPNVILNQLNIWNSYLWTPQLKDMNFTYRGYHMPSRVYEFYLRVVNSISHEWVQRVCNILFIIQTPVKYQIILLSKAPIYNVTITTVISSRVKITCYLHVWRYEVFAGKLTWYFTGVYIIKNNILHLENWPITKYCICFTGFHKPSLPQNQMSVYNKPNHVLT